MPAVLRRLHRPFAVLGAACLLGSGALASAAAASPGGTTTVLDHQHTDAVAVRSTNGELALATAVDPGTGIVDLLDPSQVAFAVTDEATVAADEAFLGEAGTPVWRIAADGGPGTLTAGWSAAGVPAGMFADDEVTVRLVDVAGPGAVELWTGGADGPVRVLSSRDPAHEAFPLTAGAQVPVAWAFTAAGEYTVTLRASAWDLAGGEVTSEPRRYRFLVGARAESPEPSATATSSPAATPEPTGGAAPTATSEPTTAPTTSPRSAPTAAGPLATESGSTETGPTTAPEATAPDSPLPAPDGTLLDETARGDVTAPEVPVAPGTTVTVQVPADHQGQWLSVWVLSTPTDLGWKQVNAEGTFTATLPADLALGGHRLVVRERDAALVGWAPVAVADPEEAVEECIATPVTTTVSAGDVDVVTSGHFDFGPVVEGDTLRALVKDDRTSPASWVDPGTLVFHLTDAAAVQPPGGAFAFLGPDTVWQIPLTQSPDVPWLGWNTQHPTVAGHTAGTVTLTLDRLDGPGELAVYSLDSWGGLGARYFGTAEGFPRSATIDVGTSGVHVHGIWAFTEPGAYRATLSFAGDIDGRQQTGTSTLTFFVGAGDPTSAVAERSVTQYVGRTPSGAECELPPALAETGVDPRQAEDLLGLAGALLLVGLAFVGAAALGRAIPAPSAA